MLQHKLKSLVLVALLLTTSRMHAQTAGKKDEAVIKARIDQFVADFKSGNGAGFVDIFSDSYYSPQKKKGLIQSIEQMAQNYRIDYEIQVDEIKVDQDMAYEVGSFRSTLTPKAQGDVISESYDFLDVWERESDGKWRITKAMKIKKEN